MTKKIEVPVILLEQLRQQLTGVMDEAPDAACSLIGYLEDHERHAAASRPTFLFHTMLDELVPGAAWHDDHVTHTTSASLQAEGHTATLEFTWPVHDTGWDLDCLTDDCRQMTSRVLDTFNRHVSSGHVQSVHCYMAPRKPATALSDPGWLEWGVYLRYEGGHSLYIAHIQRAIGADVERHT